MATSGKFVTPLDVGERAEKSLADQAAQERKASSRPAHADSDDASVDGSFLMTLLRVLSAWST